MTKHRNTKLSVTDALAGAIMFAFAVALALSPLVGSS